jgi:hypothetical protein
MRVVWHLCTLLLLFIVATALLTICAEFLLSGIDQYYCLSPMELSELTLGNPP